MHLAVGQETSPGCQLCLCVVWQPRVVHVPAPMHVGCHGVMVHCRALFTLWVLKMHVHEGAVHSDSTIIAVVAQLATSCSVGAFAC